MDVFEYMQFTTKIAVLKINKNISTSFLTPFEIEELSAIKNTRRRKEYIAIRNLKNHLFGKTPILYNQHGAPTIDLEKNISISHSKEYAVIAYSEKHPVGVDIEEENRDVSLIEKKFISKEEHRKLSHEKGNSIKIWCIKEALYKLHQKKRLDFITDLSCEKINENIWKGTIRLDKKKEHLFFLKKFKNHIICFNFEQR